MSKTDRKICLPFASVAGCADIYMSYGTRADRAADYRRHMASQFMQCTVGGRGGGGVGTEWRGGYVVGRCIKQKQSKSMACKQCHTTRAPVTIFHHMSTCPHPSLCVRMYCIPSLNLSTSTCIDYPDSEVSNMSPVGTDLSRFCRCTGSAHSLPPCSTQHLT